MIRLSFGLLKRLLEELSKSVTHLLVRQKQITVGMPSKNEEAITTPKTKEELHEIFKRAYSNDANSYALSQVKMYPFLFKSLPSVNTYSRSDLRDLALLRCEFKSPENQNSTICITQ